MARRQDIIQVPHLDPKDLYDRRVRRDHARLRSYNTLLEQIYHRVYTTSQLSGNTSSVLYTVPPFILGLPKLDMEDCVVYLVWQLRQAKFEVRFTWPNLLYISWQHHEGDYLTRQNPIIQAMMPVAPPPKAAALARAPGGSQKKKGGGGPGYAPGPGAGGRPAVAFNQDIEIINQSSPRGPQQALIGNGPGQGQGQVRRAIDYEPPASFVQNMERPLPVARAAWEPGPGSGPSRQGQMTTGAKGNVLADLWSFN